MSSITVEPEEFADIIIAYLFDMLRDEDKIPDNERIQKVMDIMKKTGLKTHLYQAFISMDTDTRVKYKRVKGAIHGEGNSNTLIKVLNGDKERIVDSVEQDFDRELCKQVFRKIKEV